MALVLAACQPPAQRLCTVAHSEAAAHPGTSVGDECIHDSGSLACVNRSPTQAVTGGGVLLTREGSGCGRNQVAITEYSVDANGAAVSVCLVRCTRAADCGPGFVCDEAQEGVQACVPVGCTL